jgi:hypothetical protein
MRKAVLSSVLAVIGLLLTEAIPVYSHTPITTNITFQKEISRIFQRRCMSCHSEGSLAMPLTTYAESRPWAVAIKEEILERRMPPWSAVNGYGHFANDASLTSREVAVIAAWVTGGAPSGVLKAEETTPPVMVPQLGGWVDGAPDAVLEVGKDHTVAADSGVTTARFEVATGLASAKWLRALQFDPGDHRVAAWASISEAGTGRWLGSWTPLSATSRLPDGVAFRLAPGAKLIVEVGYRGTNEAVSGAGSLGLYFAGTRPRAMADAMTLASSTVSVPPHAVKQRVRVEKTLTEAVNAGALFPQLADGGRSIEVTAVRPDGDVEPLLWVDQYRPEWRSPYVFREPVRLPAGTRLIATAWFDNPRQTAIEAKLEIAVTAWASAPPVSTPGK